MIRLGDLRVDYGGRDALRGIDLSVDEGEMTALLGPNGAGKSTLLGAVSGVVTPRRGSVRVAGADMAGLSPRDRAKRVAVTPQGLAAPGDLTILSIVLMGRYPHLVFWRGHGPADLEAARRALDETRLGPLAGRPAGEVSGGELQRALLARALCQETRLLLLDEAAAHLDVARKVEIHDLLRRKNARGLTILAAVHDLNLAALYFDRLIFLKDGRVVADGPTRRVFTATTLSDVYETEILVFAHPRSGLPQCVLAPSGDRGPAPLAHPGGPDVPDDPARLSAPDRSGGPP